MNTFIKSKLANREDIVSDIVKKTGLSIEQATKLHDELFICDVYLNDTYQVNVQNGIQAKNWFWFDQKNLIEYKYLSIKRRDKEPIFDINNLQTIKDELAGEDTIGIELYPSNKRVLDTANQYHMFVFPKENEPFLFDSFFKNFDSQGNKPKLLHDKKHEISIYEMDGHTCLKIRRHDGKFVRDWREIQNIKNNITSESREGAMIFPNKKSKLDKNYSYLFVLPEGKSIPLGKKIGLTIGDISSYDGAKQRPFFTNTQSS